MGSGGAAAAAAHKQRQVGSATAGRRRPARLGSGGDGRGPRLPASTLLQFERQGFVATRRLLAPEQLSPALEEVERTVKEQRLGALRQRVRVLCPGADPAGVRSEAEALRLIRIQGEELGFLQFFNLHRTQPAVDTLVRCQALASTAAQLLGCRRLRLYQDCVFLKEPSYQATNWHSDLRMAPLDTNHFVTAWIPLRDIQGGEGRDSGLVFASGSHRDFALPFWYDLRGMDLAERGYRLQSTGAMALGDVSWHHGWTVHAASPQPPGTPRRLALAASFFADGARLLDRGAVRSELMHDEDAESYAPWLHGGAGGLRGGARARHALLPVVHPPGGG